MTRVAFFNPYQGGLGGGEKYLYSLLEVAVRAGTQVTLFTPGRAPRELWEELGISVASNEVDWRHAGQLSVTARTLRWDLFVAITNHFPPLSGAKRSAAIVQFPFSRLDEASHMPLGLGRLRALERRLRLTPTTPSSATRSSYETRSPTVSAYGTRSSCRRPST